MVNQWNLGLNERLVDDDNALASTRWSDFKLADNLNRNKPISWADCTIPDSDSDVEFMSDVYDVELSQL